MTDRQAPAAAPMSYEALPKDVRDALLAADRLLAGLQAGMPPDLFDRIAEPYDELSFLLDRIGAPRV